MELNPNYPTPVEHLPRLSRVGPAPCDLWVKREDLTHPVYGGNKVRKLQRILADARASGVRRLVTVGAAGSHQVLATALFGREAGFEVEAVLLPQPRSDHAVENLRAALGLGVRVFPVGSYAAVPLAVLRRLSSSTEGAPKADLPRRRALYVPLGGSNLRGTLGYVDAAREIARQVRAGAMPKPDVVVVTLGSGGTAAGLAAGFATAGLITRVVGVAIAAPVWALSLAARWLAFRCGRVRVRLSTESRYLGQGYGHRTPEGDRATMLAADSGLTLDPTYTAKTFAAALDLVEKGPHRHVLYVHTLSSAPLAPLLAGAPPEEELPPELLRLFQ